MAVLCEAISVIIKKKPIETNYEGGWNSFMVSIPNATFCTDGELVRVGFFTPGETENYVHELELKGLFFQRENFEDSKTSDIAIVDQYRGPTLPWNWIEFGKFEIEGYDGKISMCWLYDDERLDVKGIHLKDLNMKLHSPAGWKPENSQHIHFKE
jgi:hypothetical protein